MLTFEIPGHLNSNHRPRSAVVRGKLLVYKDGDYAKFVRRAKASALRAAAMVDWTMPPLRNRVRVYIHTWRLRRADADNIIKPILDALTGIFFSNDLYAVPCLFPDRDDWVTTVKCEEQERTLVGVELLDRFGLQQRLTLESREEF